MAAEDRNPMQGVSGPGKFAKRTDLAFKPDAYGQGVEMTQQMQGAPMATSPDVRGATPTAVRQAAEKAIPQEPLTSLYAPTQRPNEPITTGVDVGAGPGSQVLAMQNPVEGQYVSAYDLIQRLASNPDASPTLQYLAQRIQQGF